MYKVEFKVLAILFQAGMVINELDRIEIAKLCAQQNGSGTAENIKNFDITDGNYSLVSQWKDYHIKNFFPKQ